MVASSMLPLGGDYKGTGKTSMTSSHWSRDLKGSRETTMCMSGEDCRQREELMPGPGAEASFHTQEASKVL